MESSHGKRIQMSKMNDGLDRSMRLKLVIEDMLKDIDMSGEEWNDRDKDGVAYWEKWNKND
jgi:hypothetical protein